VVGGLAPCYKEPFQSEATQKNILLPCAFVGWKHLRTTFGDCKKLEQVAESRES